MHLVPLAPLFTGLTLSGLMLLGGRQHRTVSREGMIYRFPRVWAYFMWGSALVFAGFPFLPGVVGNMPFLSFAGFVWAFASFALAVGVYLMKYRAVMTDDALIVGAVFPRRVALGDIVEVRQSTGNGAQLVLKLRKGWPVRLSGLLADFDTLTEDLANAPGVRWITR